MKKRSLKEYIAQADYSTKYLPIYKQKSHKIYAYEALSQFTIGNQELSSQTFFQKLHDNEKLFFYLERKNKLHQIANASEEHKLILHFDAIVFSQKEYREFWKTFLIEHKKKIIIDISHEQVQEQQIGLMKWLSKHGLSCMMSVSYDDFNQVSFEYLEKATYIKIHKKLLNRVIKNPSYLKLLRAIVEFCKENNTKTIIKRLDHDYEVHIAKELGIDYIQGTVLD